MKDYTEFGNQPNASVTRDTLMAAVPKWAGNPVAWYAMRAILQEVQHIGLPKSWLVDMAQDFSILHKYPAERFVYCIRAAGTHLFTCPFPGNGEPLESLRATAQVFGNECHWYTFDLSDVRNQDDYNEPHLRPCSAEAAYTYLADIIG